jgi:hypothetical protein
VVVIVTSGREEVVQTKGRKLNTLQKCIHKYINSKMISIETTPGMGGGKINESGGEVNSSMIYFIHCKNFCKDRNVPPLSTTIKKQQRPNK